MARWTVDSIHWENFDRSKVNADLLALAKTASVVEYNSADYVTYLRNVFKGDTEFCAAVDTWGEEEIQHGLALAKWAELADPSWNFERALERFRESFQVPLNASESIRGSRSAELVARCMVEVGTTTYYSSLRDASDEPVFKEICHLIAVDEIHHYNLFYRALPHYLQLDPLTKWERAKVAFSRAAEAEDEELLYAYAATNTSEEIKAENLPVYLREYMGRTMPLYTKKNFQKGMTLAVRAIGADHLKWLPGIITTAALTLFKFKGRKYNRERARGHQLSESISLDVPATA
jgi:hypothetical protein